MRWLIVASLTSWCRTSNEQLIQQSLKFHIEHAQLETRLRLDIPALSSQAMQDLLRESEMFARSFNGVGGLGLLSPFDLVRTFVVVGSEVLGRAWLVWGLWNDFNRGKSWESFAFSKVSLPQVFVVISVVGPTVLSILNGLWNRWYQTGLDSPTFMGGSTPDLTGWPHVLYNQDEAEVSETHERMRRLAYDESFKSEVRLLAPDLLRFRC